MNDNLKIYNLSKSVPEKSCKTIKGGRLKGMTDINPMWRIEKLTELFGVVGFGWYYTIEKQWIEEGADGNVCAFCNIKLYVKYKDEWSKPIEGTGGNSFITKESGGMYTSDECFKMALTDAISVACKSLGFGADIYNGFEPTKYTRYYKTEKTTLNQDTVFKCVDCFKIFKPYTDKNGNTYTIEQVVQFAKQFNTDKKTRCSNCAIEKGTFVNIKGD